MDSDIANALETGKQRSADIEKREIRKLRYGMVAIMLAIFVYNLHSFLHQTPIEKTGKVAFSAVKEVTNRRSHYFTVDVRFSYEASNSTHTGWDSVGRYKSRTEAADAASKIVPGSDWSVRYNEGEPDVANKSICATVAGIVLPLAMICICLFWGIICYK